MPRTLSSSPVRFLSTDLHPPADKTEELVSSIRRDNPTENHIVAFSGGVDSSLALKLTSMAFPTSTRAVIGLSAALPASQLEFARSIAKVVDVPLTEVETNEGENEEVRAGAKRQHIIAPSKTSTRRFTPRTYRPPP